MTYIKNIALIPISIICVAFAYWLISAIIAIFVNWIENKNWIFLIFMLLVFGFVIRLFTALASLLFHWISKISTNDKYSFWVIVILCVINAIATFAELWFSVESYTSKLLVINVFMTLLIANFTFESITMMNVYNKN